jgi:hypothetical protein
VEYMAHNLEHLLPRWQRIVESYYETLKIHRIVAKSDYEAAELKYQEASQALLDYQNSERAWQVQVQVQR